MLAAEHPKLLLGLGEYQVRGYEVCGLGHRASQRPRENDSLSGFLVSGSVRPAGDGGVLTEPEDLRKDHRLQGTWVCEVPGVWAAVGSLQ